MTRERHAKGDASAFSRGPSLATRNKEELAHSDDTFAKDRLVSCGLAKCSLGNCGEIPSFISLLPSPSLRAFSTFLRTPPPPTFPPPCPGQRLPYTTWTRGSSDFKSDGPSNNFLCYKPLHFFYFKFIFFFFTGGCCIPRTQKYKAVAGKWKCLWAWAGLSKVERYCIRVL